MPNTIYERLALNFDTAKFGNVSVLGQKTLDYYKQFPDDLKDWQYDAIVNSTAGQLEFFQNPMEDISNSLKIVIDDMANLTFNVNFENNVTTGNLIYTTSVATSSELLAFKSHTANISGASTEPMSTANVPSYDLVLSIGNELQRLVTSKENIANASPFLGSLTSLFIEPDLEEKRNILIIDKGLVANSIRTEIIVDELEPLNNYTVNVSNLSSVQVNSVYANVSSLYSLINTRRTEDWEYYKRSKDVLDDYFFLKRFDNIGNTQTELINQYIGTDRLKNIISNT